MTRQERANLAAEAGFPLPARMGGQPAYADFGSILSVAGPIIGGLVQKDSADTAASAQQQSTDAAVAEQRRQYDLSRSDLAPWRTAGGQSVSRLSELLGLTPQSDYGATGRANFDSAAYLAANPDVAADAANYAKDPYRHFIEHGQAEGRAFTPINPNASAAPPADYGSLLNKFTGADLAADPVYNSGLQFGLTEGEKALTNMARARGSLNSGSTLKAISRYANDYGTTKAADSYSRFVNDQTNLYNRLAGVSGSGQQATTSTASAGMNSANNTSNLVSAMGNSRGAASIAGGNALGGAFSGAANNYMNNQLIGSLLNRGNVGQTAASGTYGSGGTYGLDY